MPALSIQNATKRFERSVVALDNICIEIRDGELLAVVGPSGSGKTTLLRAIAGLEKLDTGTIRLGDVVLDILAPRRRDIGMIFQQPALYPHLSVRDNIAFPLRLRGETRANLHQQAEETATRLDLKSLLDRRPDQLSGGQAQRVSLARALVRRPKCLLMDEPLSNLDAPLRIEMREQLKTLHAAFPMTTLHVTHDQDEALAIGDRVAVFHEGRLQQLATPEEITTQPANEFVSRFFRHLRR